MKIKHIHIRFAIVFSISILTGLIFAGPSYPVDKFKLKSGAKGKLCLKCHETFKKTLKSRFVHPLLKKEECTGCHVPHSSSHKNLLTAATTRLCYGCHQEVLPDEAPSAHKIVVEGNCKKCHDSHGSNNKFILIKSGNDLCFDCHKDISDNVNNVQFKHKSIDIDKGCLNCHNPHASAKSNFLLEKDAPSLCLKCHKTNTPTFARRHSNYAVADAACDSCHSPHGSNKRGIIYDEVHAPVAENKCTECHFEPTSPNALEIKKQGSMLCRQCHKDMIDKTFNKNRLHWPLADNVGCLNCHSPHGTKQKKLLKGTQIKVCGKCHEDTIKLQEWSKNNPKNKSLCEPIKKGNCTSCHTPHASDNVLLINQTNISIDLCRKCHEWLTHSSHPIGAKVVDQRNKNLSVECLSCHKACGTGNKPSMLPFETTHELCIQCHIERRK